MNVLVQGWNVFSFLIKPEELREILKEYHLIINNAHVLLDYTESSLAEYVDIYSKLYDLFTSGEKIVLKRDHSLFVNRGVTSNLAKCKYGRVHEYEGQQYKTAEFDEPVVNLVPFVLNIYKDSKQKWCCQTNGSYLMNPQDFMGIQLQFPKKIQYENEGVYGELKSTNYLEHYQVYVDLKNRINKMTKNLVVQIEGETVKTNIWMSEGAKKDLCRSYFFKNNNVSVKM